MPVKAGIPYGSGGESIVLMLALPVDTSFNLPRPGAQRLPQPVALLLHAAIHRPRLLASARWISVSSSGRSLR